MGYRFVTLDPTPGSPCGQVTPQIEAAYGDEEAARKLAERSDVITYEFENVDAGVAALLERESYVPQGSALLYTTQHRLREKRAIEAAGVPVAPYREVTDLQSLVVAAGELGLPCVLKTATGGYDGEGQAVIREADELETAYRELAASGSELVLEKFIPFRAEVSVIAARSPKGEIKSFPVSENIHVNGILHLSIVPARVEENIQREARKLAERLAEKPERSRTSGRRDVRDGGRRTVRQRSRAASPQLRALHDGGLRHLAVRTAYPGDLQSSAGGYDAAHPGRYGERIRAAFG
ncbi:ATP-grasp domain-containing protein [Paenibacillus sp. JTLBN-2024]